MQVSGSLSDRLYHFAEANALFHPQDKLLVAVSGGLDSVVLTDLLYKRGYEFSIAHCNFKLRGKESDEDEGFVRELANNYQVPFYASSFDTKGHSDKYSVSTQMAARDLRYSWFSKLMKEEGLKYLLTAHHLDDSLETVLLNFTKGTGIAGLHGIPAKNDHIRRPLLFATREEISEYARLNNLTWREDSSNLSNGYQRNLIRNEVVPLLKRINPQLAHTFKSTQERVGGVEDFFITKVEEIRRTIFHKEGDCWVLNYKALTQEGKDDIVLLELLKPFQFTWSDIKNVVQPGHGVKRFYSPSHKLIKYEEIIRVSPLVDEIERSEVLIEEGLAILKLSDVQLQFEVIENTTFVPDKSSSIAYFDFDTLKFPLKLRPWQVGDSFQPLGMKGRKKLSDFLIDKKVPLDKKSEVYVLISGEEIIWVMGMRLSDRMKVQPHTSKVLRIEIVD